jgi:hypothetical protein
MNVFGMVTTNHSHAYTDYALSSFFRMTALGPDDLFFLIDNDGTYNRPLSRHYPRLTQVNNRTPLSFAANVNQILHIAQDNHADLFFLNNDIIFTPNWLGPLLVSDCALLSPVSNLQMRYRYRDFACGPILDLADYLGHEDDLAPILQTHQAQARGYQAVLKVPFFCIKIPYVVSASVGSLDESFGKGGAEDVDYCLRCHLAGFGVKWALETYLLHFMGKSTWRGAETAAQTRQREQQYVQVFREKWGKPLLEIMLFNKLGSVQASPSLWHDLNQGNFKRVIEHFLPTETKLT